MNPNRQKALRVALIVVACACIALGPLMLFWPEGWRWEPHQPRYEQMMVGIYFTLGIFLFIAARDPVRHRSLIWFAVWSSVVHANIMAVQAVSDPHSRGHLIADVPALLVAAVVLGVLMGRERPA